MTVDPSGKVIRANSAMANVTGVSQEKLVEADFFSFFTEPDKARQLCCNTLVQGQVSAWNLSFAHIDGNVVDVHANASVYRDRSGKVLGVFFAAQDITEHQAEHQHSEGKLEWRACAWRLSTGCSRKR